jgi:hypothetical protein
MNAHEEYFKAVVPDPHVVLNLALQPFCAGHILLLHRFGSVFVRGGTVTKDELETAVFLCAHTFEDAVASLHSDETKAKKDEWLNGIKGYRLVEKLAAFQQYIEAGSLFPLIFAPKRDHAEIAITNLPALHSVRCALRHYYHISDLEFWNMPWGLAQWDYFTIPVMEGTGDLVEQDALQSARNFAEADFKRANPQLFNADGSRKEAPDA